jgi:hypothetical protein
MNLFILVLFIICVIYTFNYINCPLETFTDEKQIFAEKVLNFFKTPNSFITYSDFLINNNNMYKTLALKQTYDSLKSKNITLQDILLFM